MKNVRTILGIAELGHPILRKKAKNLTGITDSKTQEFIDNLIKTVKDVDGVGIAAPQVYKSLRLFILASFPNPRYPKAPKMRPTPIINPTIVRYGGKKEKDWEGCLSIPGIRGLVPRYSQVEAEYYGRDGKKRKKVFRGFVARIFQHEYDHIEGSVFLDRVASTADLVTEKLYRKILLGKKE